MEVLPLHVSKIIDIYTTWDELKRSQTTMVLNLLISYISQNSFCKPVDNVLEHAEFSSCQERTSLEMRARKHVFPVKVCPLLKQQHAVFCDIIQPKDVLLRPMSLEI